MILAGATDPISAILTYKEAGLVVVALTMFLANFAQNYQIKKANERLGESIKELTESFTLAKSKAEERWYAIFDSQHKLTEQLEVLATNQLNQTHSLNEVVRELIGIIREGDR